MPQKAVVIGAGLAGLQTARFLQNDGLDVTVVERRDGVALETSFANGGLVTPSHSAPWNSPGIFRTLLSSLNDESAALYLKASAIPSYFFWGLKFLRASTPARYFRTIERNSRLAHYSQDILNGLVESLDLHFDSDRRGTIMFYRSQPAFDRVKAINERVAASGVRVDVCTADDLVRIEPALGAIGGQLSGGFYYPGDQHGDAHLFCKALAEKMRDAGIKLRFSETVTGFETSGARVTGVVTDKEVIRADVVVMAAGFWSAEASRGLGLSLPIKPVKGYSVTFDLPDTAEGPSIPVVDDESHIGLTPLGSRIRFVGTAEFSGYSPEINPARIDNLRRAALATYPALAPVINGTHPVSTWCGHRPMTPDCLPLIGQAGPENLYLNTGHGYLGWTTASGTSRAVADLILGKEPGLAVDDYRLKRF